MKYSMNKIKHGLGEVQSLLHWYVIIVKPASAVGNFPEDLQIRVTTSSLPEVNIEHNKIELQGHVINSVGKVTKAGEITWTFYEGTDSRVISYFSKWMNAYWSGDGKDTYGVQNSSANLKADLQLNLLSPSDVTTQSYTLVGCLPKMSFGGELGQVSDSMKPVVTWSYDDFHIKTNDISW